MSQMQTFEFLSTLASLKLPETVSDKQDYFSDADAAAWAKEAEAAGLKTDIEDENHNEKAESLANDREQNEQRYQSVPGVLGSGLAWHCNEIR